MPRSIWLERSVVLVAALVVVGGLGAYGIWDPWELESGRTTELMFALFGRNELGARLTNALAGLCTAGCAYYLCTAVGRPRAGTIAVAMLVSTPLFLMNARLAMGDAIGVAAQGCVGVAVLTLNAGGTDRTRTILNALFLLAAIALSTQLSGVLLGPLPPLAATAAWMTIGGERKGHGVTRWLAPAFATLGIVGVVCAVSTDAPNYSIWLGAGAVGGDPPPWSKAFELLFHGFAPWSAALPVAFASALWPAPGRPPRVRSVGWALVLWLVFAFVSWTVFASRYGTPPVLAMVPVAALLGLWLDDPTISAKRSAGSAVVIALFAGLLLRDYAIYPDLPLRTLAAAKLSMPPDYRARGAWALVLVLAAASLCLLLLSPGAKRPRIDRTMQRLREQWNAAWPARGWMIALVSLLGACVGFGLMCFAFDLPIASIVVRGGRFALFVPLLLVAAIFGLPWLPYLQEQLGTFRILPVLIAALAAAGFIAWSFVPNLSEHYSPKPAYETYAALRRSEDDPLAIYRLGVEAARYYTDADLIEIDDSDALLEFLRAPERRWALIPSEQLVALDAKHRDALGRHLYVADARSTNLVLITGTPVSGRTNRNFLASLIKTDDFAPEYPLEADFDGRVALLGYDLVLPAERGVGAGQHFEVTWYWRLSEPPPRGYEVFVHIDGNGLRLNGDHEPTGGRYPLSRWRPGEIIADSQKLRVPANFRPGDYVLYVGWFRGAKRLPVVSGPSDGVDRVRAGVLPVR
jgi:hypothetical protein